MSGIRYFSEVLNQKGAPALYEDTIDNIPAATFEGRLFFATDVVSGDTIFRDNGDGTWSALAGNGGGGTFINGVTDLTGGVGLGGSLDQDTEILLNGLSFKLTNNGNNFLIDTVNNLYYFGKGNDLDAGLGIQIVADAFTNFIGTTYGNLGDIGIGLDFGNRVYQIGDFALSLNGTTLQIDEVGQAIRTKNFNNEIGLKLDFANDTYYFGDYDAVNDGTFLTIDNNNTNIETNFFGTPNGLRLNAANWEFNFGDWQGLNNSTFLSVIDGTETIEFVSASGFYNFANVPVYANNAAALAAGLNVGDIYRHDASSESGDQLRIVH